MRIAVIDYGAGNLASVLKGLRAAGSTPFVTTTPRDLETGDAIVIPGVGHFNATAALTTHWQSVIRAHIDAGAAVLGICLGMQWLYEGSDEAPDLPGLGVLSGRCARLIGDAATKIPHVGWNALSRRQPDSRLLAGLPDAPYVYFTHTFAAPVTDDCMSATRHGTTFASTVERQRVFGTQWHPEKSGQVGLAVLQRFLDVARSTS